LILDLTPTDSAILGFGNRWYGLALRNSTRIRIGETEIRLISASCFLATKLEAFHRRGRDDYEMSHDLEDIITVIDGRPELAKEVSACDNDLRGYLREEFHALLKNRNFLDALPGHLLPDTASQQRITLILSRIQKIATESSS
jgi:hypothetical protein